MHASRAPVAAKLPLTVHACMLRGPLWQPSYLLLCMPCLVLEHVSTTGPTLSRAENGRGRRLKDSKSTQVLYGP